MHLLTENLLVELEMYYLSVTFSFNQCLRGENIPGTFNKPGFLNTEIIKLYLEDNPERIEIFAKDLAQDEELFQTFQPLLGTNEYENIYLKLNSL